MERILTTEVKAHAGERVRIAGWLQSQRLLGGISFLVIRDGWGTVQAVAETEEEIRPLVEANIGVESVLAIEELVANAVQAPGVSNSTICILKYSHL